MLVEIKLTRESSRLDFNPDGSYTPIGYSRSISGTVNNSSKANAVDNKDHDAVELLEQMIIAAARKIGYFAEKTTMPATARTPAKVSFHLAHDRALLKGGILLFPMKAAQ